MPVIIPETLPATQCLTDEGIFVMNKQRANTQDIRPLKIAILNLMPNKIATETQLLRKLSNSIVQVEITLVAIEHHQTKNTAQSHLNAFYRHFNEIKHQFFDGLIITGAPVEHLDFEAIDYWQELQTILDWSKNHVFCSLFICWASQAALYHFYGINKEPFANKLSGVYPHKKSVTHDALFFGMDDVFYVPQSRNTASTETAIRNHNKLVVLAESDQAGIHLVATHNRRQVFMSGHPEYDDETLLNEFLRDSAANKNVPLPQNYFHNNDPSQGIETRWKSHAALFYQNWLNYYVYQATNYELNEKTLIKPD